MQTSSPACDQYPVKAAKATVNPTLKPLVYISNLRFSCGVFPGLLRMGVTLIFKEGHTKLFPYNRPFIVSGGFTSGVEKLPLNLN